MLRVLVADGDSVSRGAMRALVDEELAGQFVWMGMAADGNTAAQLARQQRPHVAVLAADLPGVDGLAVASGLIAVRSDAQIILLAEDQAVHQARQAIALGVLAYLVKPVSAGDLLANLRKASDRACEIAAAQRRERFMELTGRLVQRWLTAQLISGHAEYSAEMLQECAAAQGLNQLPNAVVVAEWSGAGVGQETVLRGVEGWLPRSLLHQPDPDRLVALLAMSPNNTGKHQLEATAKELEQRLTALCGCPVQVGPGGPESSWTELHSAYTQALTALGCGERCLPEPLDCASALGSEQGLAVVLRRLADAVFSRNAGTRADLIRWGFALLAVCRSHLAGMGCPGQALARTEAVWSQELMAVRYCVDFVTWARGALAEFRTVYHGCSPGNARQIVREVASYLDQQYTQDLHLESVARRFALSPSYLSRTFKQEHGVAFHKYLEERRLNAARTLLASSGAGVRFVARSTGFRSHPHFCAVFKRRFEISPTDYRATLVAPHTHEGDWDALRR